jgi:predicted transcriptional regulator
LSQDLPPLSETELEVLKTLWQHGPGTVREVNEELPRWAYTTVQTLLTRLERKGYVACDRSGFAHVFRTLVTRDKLVRRRLSDLVEEFSQEVTAPLVLALVERQRLSPQEIQRLRQVLDRLEARQEGQSPGEDPSGKGRKKKRSNPSSRIDL